MFPDYHRNNDRLGPARQGNRRLTLERWGEESPDSTGRALGNPQWGQPQDSATENRPPPGLQVLEVRVKRWGKSPPVPAVTLVAW